RYDWAQRPPVLPSAALLHAPPRQAGRGVGEHGTESPPPGSAPMTAIDVMPAKAGISAENVARPCGNDDLGRGGRDSPGERPVPDSRGAWHPGHSGAEVGNRAE